MGSACRRHPKAQSPPVRSQVLPPYLLSGHPVFGSCLPAYTPMPGTNAPIFNIIESFIPLKCRHVGTSADHRHCRFVGQWIMSGGVRTSFLGRVFHRILPKFHLTRSIYLPGGTMTDAKLLVPAALYLRMSAEHQQYSLENQSTAIQKYADSGGFEAVPTYSDAARSGLVLRRRAGLRQLLQDVVAGTAPYRAILVYDVSRWGRFQDTDESAHYEFLCKSAGVPVHYCAETFANDGTLPSLIMKTLKRTMAAEYSRELGVKVLAGQKRLAGLGFKQGGMPGYGLRRMLISSERGSKQELAKGERKSIATDRVILVPGPTHEVQCVREIYRMLVAEKLSVNAIARELNEKGIKYVGDSKWNNQAVYGELQHLHS